MITTMKNLGEKHAYTNSFKNASKLSLMSGNPAPAPKPVKPPRKKYKKPPNSFQGLNTL